MPVTRTQQNILDKEIDFNRKDENDSKVMLTSNRLLLKVKTKSHKAKNK